VYARAIPTNHYRTEYNMVQKFAVGDRVKVVEITHGAPSSTIGMIGIVREYNTDESDCTVDFPQINDYWFYVESELEFVASAEQVAPEVDPEDIRIARLVMADGPKTDAEYALASALIRIADRSI